MHAKNLKSLSNLKKLPYPGLRNIKTAIAIALCLVFYEITGRKGISMGVVAAIICMQSSVEKTIQEGISRVIGTVVGGFFGILIVGTGVLQKTFFLRTIVVSLGVMLLIYLFNLIQKNSSIVIGCVVFMVICLDSGIIEPVMYAIARVVDTLVGIGIAVVVNHFVFRPKPERYEEHIVVPHEVVEMANLQQSTWSGGTTTQLYIFPQMASFFERDFKWRVSVATVDVNESCFSQLNGYVRHVIILEGQMQLFFNHEKNQQNWESPLLKPFDQYEFDAEAKTKTNGICKELNLMIKKGAKGQMSCVYANEKLPLLQEQQEPTMAHHTCCFYALEEVLVQMDYQGKTLFSHKLAPHDFIVLEQLEKLDAKGYWVELVGAKKMCAIRMDIFS